MTMPSARELLLGRPIAYEGFQMLVGARTFRPRYVRELIRPFSGAKVLDIGCGPGSYYPHLRRYDVDYYGFDENPSYIRYAARKYRGDSRAHFVCRRVEKAGVSDLPKFDRIIAFGLMHHLSDSSVSKLLELGKSLLAARGLLITMDPFRDNSMSSVERLLVRLDRGEFVRTPERMSALVQARFQRFALCENRDLSWILPRSLSFVCENDVET